MLYIQYPCLIIVSEWCPTNFTSLHMPIVVIYSNWQSVFDTLVYKLTKKST